MKYKLLIFLLITNLSILKLSAQTNNQYKTIFYREVNFENDIVKVELVDIISSVDFNKFKIRIKNKTSDYMIFKPGESVFKFAHGDMKPADKADLVLKPYDTGSRVLTVTGDSRIKTDKFSFVPGTLLLIPAEGNVEQATDFKLPVAVNEAKTNNFSCTCGRVTKETKITIVPFKCIFNGNDYGILNPASAIIKLENGQEFAISNVGLKGALLQKGQDESFALNYKVPAHVADMQFANMTIVWKNTFATSKAKKVELKIFDLEIDPGLTAGKNK